jgi:hypothetical protein
LILGRLGEKIASKRNSGMMPGQGSSPNGMFFGDRRSVTSGLLIGALNYFGALAEARLRQLAVD